MLASVYKELFAGGTVIAATSVSLTGQTAALPPELSLRMLSEYQPPNPGEGLYVLDLYLRDRGDKNIKNVRDLIGQSTFYNHAPIDGVTLPPKARLEGLLTRTERFTKKSDGST